MNDATLNELFKGNSIRGAFKAYGSVKLLGTYPLADLEVVKARCQNAGYPDTAIGRGMALRDILTEAVEAIKPLGTEFNTAERSWRYYLILKEQFLQNRTPASVADELHISKPTYFNEQKKALETVAELFCQWEIQRLKENDARTSSPEITGQRISLSSISTSENDTSVQGGLPGKNLIYILLSAAFLFFIGIYIAFTWRQRVIAAGIPTPETVPATLEAHPSIPFVTPTSTMPPLTISNLAREASALADSYYRDDSMYAGEKARDGAWDTQWRSKEEGKEHWLNYDLGSYQLVNSFSVYYTGANEEGEPQSNEFEIHSSNESITGPWTVTEANMAAGLTPEDSGLGVGRSTWCYSIPKPLRYVQLHLPDANRPLSIPEFQVWSYSEGDLPGRNLALEAKEVQQDSYYKNGPEWTGAKANDGRLDTKWTSGDLDEPHWLSYDLGEDMLVYGFVVYHAGAGGEMRMFNTQQFKVQSAGSMDGPWVDEAEAVNLDQGANRTRCYFGEGRIIRYIRLLLIDPGPDALARIPEFEVWGEGKSNVSTGTPIIPPLVNSNLSQNANVLTDSYYRDDSMYAGEKARDGDWDTQWRSKEEEGEHWLNYDLGSYQLVNSFSMYYTGAKGNFEIRSSSESITGPWTVTEANMAAGLAPEEGEQGLGRSTWCYSIPKPLRYVQLRLIDANRVLGISEFQVWSYAEGDLPGRNLALEAKEVRQDSYYKNDPAWIGMKANDGRLDTKWTSEGPGGPHWLSYDLGKDMPVYGFVVYHAGAGGEMQRFNTQQFKIQSAGSMDGPWVDEAEAVNIDQSANRTRCYFGEERIIRYIRLLLVDPGPDALARIPEFEVWGSDLK